MLQSASIPNTDIYRFTTLYSLHDKDDF
jgi:hypothetical protein